MSYADPFNSNNASTGDDNFYNFNEEDPAADFLEREKRELGDITGDGDSNSYEDPFNANNNPLTNGIYHYFLILIH